MSDNGSTPISQTPAPVGAAPPPPAPVEPASPTRKRWYHYLGPAIFALFCIELGVLLVLAPWIEIYERNIVQFVPHGWQRLLLSHQFRGALSALGFLNFLIALNELIDMVRPPSPKP